MRTALLAVVLMALPVTAQSPALAVSAAWADAQKLAAAHKTDVRFFRYLWVPTEAKLRDDFVVGLYAHVHSLSDQGAYGTFAFVKPDLLRIDMREYGFDSDEKMVVWEKSQEIDPYFHAPIRYLGKTSETTYWPGGKFDDGKRYRKGSYTNTMDRGDKGFVPAPNLPRADIDGLRSTLYTESPILNAEWFFVQTFRQISLRNKEEGFGYYDFVGVKDRDDFLKKVGVDEKLAIKIFREHRAVVVKSGVSQQNRQVVRLGPAWGVWGTLDTFAQKGRGVARLNLRRGEFLHNAEEWYGPNALGLPITIANDANGKLAATVPDQIGPAKSPLVIGNDTRIHPNQCMVCHGLGKSEHLMSIDDWARSTFKAGGPLRLQDPDKKVTLELQSQYLRELRSEIEDDRRKYARAVVLVTVSKKYPKGMSIAELTKIQMAMWNRYVEEDVSLEAAARELGTTPAGFVTKLKQYQITKGRTENTFADFLQVPPRAMPRLDWEDSYLFAATIAAGLAPGEIPEKRKVPKP